jgi:hypothetical protein
MGLLQEFQLRGFRRNKINQRLRTYRTEHQGGIAAEPAAYFFNKCGCALILAAVTTTMALRLIWRSFVRLTQRWQRYGLHRQNNDIEFAFAHGTINCGVAAAHRHLRRL